MEANIKKVRTYLNRIEDNLNDISSLLNECLRINEDVIYKDDVNDLLKNVKSQKNNINNYILPAVKKLG